MKRSAIDPLVFLVSFLGAVVTLIINPWTGYDPINVVKMGALTAIAVSIFIFVLSKYQSYLLKDKVVVILLSAIILNLLISLVVNERNRWQQIWGVWGRNTGVITYICFCFLLFAATVIGRNFRFDSVLKVFNRVSYFIILYLVIQILEIDPVNWSQKQAIATLGNINFVSAFLGFVMISCSVEILNSKISLPSRVHFLFVSIASLLIVLRSGSIQGLLMAFGGVLVVVSLKYAGELKKTTNVVLISILSLATLLIGGGAFGQGPFGSTLRQESLIYRVDYWKAGVAMTTTKPFFGRGMDSYGDYYREFRDSIATTRTGPQRTSNTAHNIFLDVSTGAGLLTSILFMGVFVLAAFRVKKLYTQRTITEEGVRLAALCFGFLIYWLISINQIGFTVWGFIFLGLLLGLSQRINEDKNFNVEKINSGGKTSFKVHSETTPSRKLLSTLLVSIGFLLGLGASLAPMVQDVQALSASRENQTSRMKNLLKSEYLANELRNKILLQLSTSISTSELITLLEREVERDNRNAFAWNALLSLQETDLEVKKKALEALRDLDPENPNYKGLNLK